MADILARNVGAREMEVLRTRVRTTEESFDQEWKKGEISGIRFALGMPRFILDSEVKREDVEE